MCCATECFLLFKGNHSKWAFRQKKNHLNAGCVVCTKHFSKLHHLDSWEDPHRRNAIHMLHWNKTFSQASEELFQCPECANNCFSIAGHLKEHMGTHSGEIPFECTKWDKSFSPSNYLETQEKSHSSAQSVTSFFQDQVPWRSMKGSTQKRSLLTAQSVTKVSQ